MTAVLRALPDGKIGEVEIGARGLIVVDFGAGSVDAQATVTGQAGITAAHVPMAVVTAVATPDHSADEHMIEDIAIYCGQPVAGVGFVVYARTGTSELYGRYTIAWSWGA